jgi:hypothetical protein
MSEYIAYDLHGNKLTYNPPSHEKLERVVIYNYFCLKLGCFFTFLRRKYDVNMVCPCCGQNDDVVTRKD